jgi:predicted amidohydrolase YtcJ
VKYIFFFLSLVFIAACSEKESAGLIIYNATFYTATGNDSIEAIAIKDDRILATGTEEEIMKLKGSDTELMDAAGQFVMPGFIEGHGHFPNFGKSLQNLNFLNDTSWNDIVEKVKNKAASSKEGEWIYGRGWHQEKWRSTPDENFGDYPTHDVLSAISPNNPVVLVHASGHSLFANAKAMDLAGINKESPDPRGGKIVRDLNGRPIGVFEERAMDAISSLYNDYIKSLNEEEQYKLWLEGFEMAQEECLKYGITSFQDAGLKYFELDRFEELAEQGKLDIRFWVMLRERAPKLSDEKIRKYRKIGIADNHYTCRAIKTEIDGALGAHGAWLIEPYADKKDFYGQNTTEISDVERIADYCYRNEMQMCVHAIGDRANKETLDIIEDYSYRKNENLRWRVEHAQHLHPSDIERFKETGAIASMQGVHCTSDAPFVEKRLGFLRAKIGAYAWKALLERDVVIVNGTDVPVESIDPFKNFYASVTRSRLDNGFRFFVEQRMNREQALRSYTLDAAYGAFEEDIKGSLEAGKLADIIILGTNLLTCTDDAIPDTKVLYTIIGGKVKYSSI